MIQFKSSEIAYLGAINKNRNARGKRSLHPDEWDLYAELCRKYQDSCDPKERADAIESLRRLNGDPVEGPGISIPAAIRSLVDPTFKQPEPAPAPVEPETNYDGAW